MPPPVKSLILTEPDICASPWVLREDWVATPPTRLASAEANKRRMLVPKTPTTKRAATATR